MVKGWLVFISLTTIISSGLVQIFPVMATGLGSEHPLEEPVFVYTAYNPLPTLHEQITALKSQMLDQQTELNALIQVFNMQDNRIAQFSLQLDQTIGKISRLSDMTYKFSNKKL